MYTQEGWLEEVYLFPLSLTVADGVQAFPLSVLQRQDCSSRTAGFSLSIPSEEARSSLLLACSRDLPQELRRKQHEELKGKRNEKERESGRRGKKDDLQLLPHSLSHSLCSTLHLLFVACSLFLPLSIYTHSLHLFISFSSTDSLAHFVSTRTRGLFLSDSCFSQRVRERGWS